MKKTILTAAMFTVAAGSSAVAASEPVCYMETATGQVIDLTALCSTTPAVSPSVSPPEMMRYQETAKTSPSFSDVSFKPADSLKEAPSEDRWQRAARSVAAMKPYWSGYCRIGNQLCAVLSEKAAARRDINKFTPDPLILIIEAEAGTPVLVLERRNCKRGTNQFSNSRRCRSRPSEFREIRL